MCLGQVANRLFGRGGSKSAVDVNKSNESSPTAKPKKVDAAQGNAGTTSMTDTGINY